MSKFAEQIAAYEAKRASSVGAMEAIMTKAAADGATLDAAQSEEYDGHAADIESIDKHLDRLRVAERTMAKSARPIEDVRDPNAASEQRGGSIIVKAQPKLAPGIAFARYAKARAVSRLDSEPVLVVAERMYGADSDVVGTVKAAVAAGSNQPGSWAAALHSPEGAAFVDFAEFLRPATILGKFGTGDIPALRKIGFDEPVILQTGGGQGYWVGEGKPKPLTSFDFKRDVLGRLKVANIAVLTEENVRSSNPSSEAIVRDALKAALVETQDLAFIDPTNAGVDTVRPASVTNGASAHVSAGRDADAVRADARAVMAAFIAASNSLTTGVWIMSATNALGLSMMSNALGQKEFPGMTMLGGTFEGLPVIVSEYAGSTVALVNALDIYEADEGDIAVDMSREASLEMKNSDFAQDGLTGAGTQLVSLWQNNLVGLRAERTINWRRRRATAVAYLTAVRWGEPAAPGA
ncbi:phage major capsid protein [Sphingomonas sp. CARO-RG-8B-R24-01]|uniref:phage major capsid protein n=1 Tax=unclassified Sphingomonas TaxID=196159 RepID=UPI001F58DF1C